MLTLAQIAERYLEACEQEGVCARALAACPRNDASDDGAYLTWRAHRAERRTLAAVLELDADGEYALLDTGRFAAQQPARLAIYPVGGQERFLVQIPRTERGAAAYLFTQAQLTELVARGREALMRHTPLGAALDQLQVEDGADGTAHADRPWRHLGFSVNDCPDSSAGRGEEEQTS